MFSEVWGAGYIFDNEKTGFLPFFKYQNLSQDGRGDAASDSILSKLRRRCRQKYAKNSKDFSKHKSFKDPEYQVT